MISNELNTIIDNLNKQGKMLFLTGATEEQIKLFEEKNGIIIPSQYKQWLEYSDGGECFVPAGIQLYGVAHRPFIEVDTDERPDKSYVVIGSLPNGDPILSQVGKDNISLYNQEAGIIEDDEEYQDFFSFLSNLCDILGIGD